jgi:hypothetical protein
MGLRTEDGRTCLNDAAYTWKVTENQATDEVSTACVSRRVKESILDPPAYAGGTDYPTDVARFQL